MIKNNSDDMFLKKVYSLKRQINDYTMENVIVAFSGGVDSSLLLRLTCDFAKSNGTKVYAVTVHTKLHPKGDIEIAKKVADESGAIHRIIEIDELLEAGIENNPKDRCYLCKKSIFNKIKNLGDELSVRFILEGTNDDDMEMYRPGIKALRELEIISPLMENGITKDEVRKMARDMGISVANRPSTPCLATRLPYGTHIDYDILDKIQNGEEYIRSLGFYNIRLRVHGDIVRIEVDKEDIMKIAEQREEITRYIKKLGFKFVTLDMEGFRSGCFDLRE